MQSRSETHIRISEKTLRKSPDLKSEQFFYAHSERFSQLLYILQGDISLAAFYAAYVGTIQVRFQGKAHLRADAFLLAKVFYSPSKSLENVVIFRHLPSVGR